MKTVLSAFLLLAVLATFADAQGPWDGYTLITPVRSTETFLIDIDGNTVQTWHGDNGAGHTVYLFPDLSVLRSQGDPAAPIRGGGGSGGHLQRIDKNDVVIWDYFYSTPEHQQHHDIEPMPNGNVLLIAWEVVTREEAIAAGRVDPDDTMLPTLIVELEPILPDDARVVWEWRIWDHIIQDVDPEKPNYGVIADHPELIDVNLGPGRLSWDHANYIDYNPELDQIVFSARGFDEVFVIDHSTTREEARGHHGGNSGMGGDILYRWGNPQNYGAGTEDDHVFWGVHGANWIDAGLPGEGGILAFNNGNRPAGPDQSSVVEIHPPMQNGKYIHDRGQAFGPAAPTWTYETGTGFYSQRYGSGFRMPNGNTIICEGGDGNIFEVNPDGTKVWVYVEPIGQGVFAAQRYWGIDTKRPTRADAEPAILHPAVPNPFNPTTEIAFSLRENEKVTLRVYNIRGQLVATLVDGILTAGVTHKVTWNGENRAGLSVASGVYFYQLTTPGYEKTMKMVLMK
jgi:hypothetical protein